MDTLEKLKTKILEWRDFYGGDILVESDVTNAKSKKDLKKVLENHRTFLEMQSLSATPTSSLFFSNNSFIASSFISSPF